MSYSIANSDDGEMVFLYTSGMRNADVPKSVKRVKIDSDVEKIENGAFKKCGELREVDFSEANLLKEIGGEAFRCCYSLLEAEIPSSVVKIGGLGFGECHKLKTVKMGKGLEYIGGNAFAICQSLVEIEIPGSVYTIGEQAFHACINLTKVKILEGQKLVIATRAFIRCTALKEVEVPVSVTSIPRDAFENTTVLSSSNLAVCIGWRVDRKSEIPMEKLVTAYAHKPITTEQLQNSNSQNQIDLLEKIKSEYIKFITSLDAKNPQLSFQEQKGWVRIVSNYDDHVNKEASQTLIAFLNRTDKVVVKALAFAKDKYGRSALRSAVPSVCKVFLKRLLFKGRYDIAPGPPLHKSATCIVVKAEDTNMDEYYREFFRRFKQKDLDRLLFGAALQLMHLVSTEGSTLVNGQIDEYFERVDLDNSGKISESEFVQFCLGQFGSNVVLKFMRNKDQFQRELDGRKAEVEDQNSDTKKDDLLAKYVVTVIRSYDETNIDTGTLQDTVGPYLSEPEKPEQYCHALVMPYGDRNLDTIFRSERPDLTKFRDMLRDVGTALLHLHEERNLVHGDLKMLNVVRVQGRLSLIDLDASTKIGTDYAGAKFSSGVLPPEMVHCLKDSSSDSSEKKQVDEYYKNAGESEQLKRAPKYSTYPRKGYVVKSYVNNEDGTPNSDGLLYKLEKAHPSLVDVWAFGVLLYAMCTGEQSLFSVSRDDDIVDGNGLEQLFDWGADSLVSERKLELKVADPYARDLLLKILQKDPKKRPTMKKVLEHAFFNFQKRNDAAMEQLQQTANQILAAEKETQKLVKREFEKIHESMTVVIHKQLAMQNMLKDIIDGEGCPQYFVILPPTKKEKKGILSWLPNNDSLKSWMYEESEARICFVCPISLQPVIGPDGEAIGYDRKLPKQWVKKYAPAILIGLKMVQVGFAVGRGFGLPFPSLGNANEKVAEKLGEASDLLSNMQDIAMEEFELDEDDDLADLLVDKISEATEDVMSAEKDISGDGRKQIQESYKGIGKLVGDENFVNCGLVEATCKDDGTTEFVHPDLKALYEEKGQALLKTMGPEMIDKAAAAARADARNMAEGAKSVEVATDATIIEAQRADATNVNPTEGGKSLEVATDATISEAQRADTRNVNPAEGSKSVEASATDATISEAQSLRSQKLKEQTSAGDSFSGENVSKVSKQIRKVKHTLNMLDHGRNLSDIATTSDGGSIIVNEGFFRIQSTNFPHRWNERQIFLYDDGSVKHFPTSGQWLVPSVRRWVARKADNGDGIELIADRKVCTTLRLSAGLIKYSSKSPERYIDEWVAILNSQKKMAMWPDMNSSSDQPPKGAPKRRIDFTGEATNT